MAGDRLIDFGAGDPGDAERRSEPEVPLVVLGNRRQAQRKSGLAAQQRELAVGEPGKAVGTREPQDLVAILVHGLDPARHISALRVEHPERA